MKKLLIQEPYAVALCIKAIDVVHLDVAPKEMPCRYLVIATGPVYNPQTPLEWSMHIHNHQVYGNIGPTDSLPVNVPVGFVDVVEQVPHDYNIWSLGLPEPVFRVKNAHLFDEPSSAWPFRPDQPLDKWLPSSRVRLAHPVISPTTLFLQVNKNLFDLAVKRASFTVDLTEEFEEVPIREDGMLDYMYDVVLLCGNREKLFANAMSEIFFEIDDAGELVTYPSLLNQGKLMPRKSLLITCDFPWIG